MSRLSTDDSTVVTAAAEALTPVLAVGSSSTDRGYIPVRHFIRTRVARRLPNDTAENAIFDSPAAGTLTLATGVYKFEAMIAVTGMSATSGNALVDFLGAGGATCTNWMFTYQGKDGTNASSTNISGSLRVTQDTPAAMVIAGTGTEVYAHFVGTFEVTTAGTIIPSIALANASATADVAVGSFFMIERFGTSDVVSLGDWS